MGLDIKDVSELLKIRADFLLSIEDDCFEKLPVAVYTMGYIRCYASYLKVDPEPILAQYKGHLTYPQSPAIYPIAASQKKVPKCLYGIAAAAFIVISFFVFLFREGMQDPVLQQTPVPSAPLQAVQSQPAPVSPDAAVQETTQIPSPAAVGPALAPERTAVGQEHSLDVTAHDVTWLLITFADGTSEEVLLRPGMEKKWTFTEKALLKIGNAGGVRLNFDGRDIDSPGKQGQVVTLPLPDAD